MLFHIVLLSFKRYYKHTGNEKEINFIYTFKHLLSCYATKFPFMYQIMPSARYKFVLQIDGYTQRLIQKKSIGLQMIKILFMDSAYICFDFACTLHLLQLFSLQETFKMMYSNNYFATYRMCVVFIRTSTKALQSLYLLTNWHGTNLNGM